ncbi:Alpha/Beta hydrolase protein [Alternaria rosae]|uniref:Alpha/Beta hydrolase protein n=1 Tax=Alternaria rosae TaxID=1187941 RepID=UPI001E8EB3CB|nr:Alpha/Beta hydrolase protein [Alternaria rosae]KAH6882072.1 Alpha/Beta hydrolase protein [Alternaria rosae]
MAPLDDTTPDNRFDSFNVFRTSYKQVDYHDIEVGILVPKDIKPGKCPVMVKFHGGGLISGDCLYADWIGAFFIPWVHRTNAIVVLPNYRLIPEHSGADILEDLSDFWKWFNAGAVDKFLNSQPTIKDSGISLDYGQTLVTGDSAGGYMALMSALTQPRDSFKAVFAQYPMTNYLRCEKVDMFFGYPAPPESIIAQHLAAVKPGAIVTSGTQPERMGLSYALAAYGHYLTYFGSDEKMWPIALVEEKKWLPPTWIVHGDADSAVSVEDSKKFVEKCKGLEEGVEVRLEVRSGQEHGFDIAAKEDEEAWLKEGLAWVDEKWLRS